MKTIAFVLKGYPRLSETFIAQEIRGLEKRGMSISIFSLRPPRETAVHPVHDEIAAPVCYLPERLREQPMRVLLAFARQLANPRLAPTLRAFFSDWRRARNTDSLRRLGQGMVLAAELPGDVEHLHAHFLHTPATVTRYASLLTGLRWTCSAHAKDIWTTPVEEKRIKLAHMDWLVTCTASGQAHLAELAPAPSRVSLLYHGIDLSRFDARPPQKLPEIGGDRNGKLEILSVGRAVAKKGFDVMIEALARLPPDLDWHWRHIGEGEERSALKALAEKHGIASRVTWLGARPQTEVLGHYRGADLFVLPCRIADDGDRDGLPNVLMEAMSQSVPCISTAISGVPELIQDGVTGVLVAPDDPDALAAALADMIRQPARRLLLGAAASRHVRQSFDCDAGIEELAGRFARILAQQSTVAEV